MGDWDIVSQTPSPSSDGGWNIVSQTQAQSTPTQPTAHQRYRSGMRQSVLGESTAMPSPYADVPTGAELARQWGNVAYGVPKGVAANVAGGMLGDIESIGRKPLEQYGVSQNTAIPTTMEGGYLGPRGIGLMNPAANEDEAIGMTLGSMIGPGRVIKRIASPALPKPSPSLPMAESLAVERPKTGARLLPSDVPHILPQRGSVGAAGLSPLQDVSPETISKLRSVMLDQGFTPYSLEQRLEEMSAHHFLGELTPNMEAAMGAVAAPPGPGKLEVINAVTQRSKEAGERMRAMFDRAFGDVDNLTQRRMLLNIEQSRAAKPFYDAFRNLRIQPTQEIMDLMPRLQAAGAFSEAKALAGVKGLPWEDVFAVERVSPGIENMPWMKGFPGAQEPVGKYPTAASWDLVKQALDSKIEQSFNQFGEPTKWTHAFTELKNELVSAIDNHPDPNIAGVWKQARDVYAEPAQIKNALNMGKRVLTERIDADELPFLTASYGRAQMEALASGMRKDLENTLGRPGKQESRVINRVLSPNNQAKIRWVIGDQEADELIRSIEHESHMHGAPTRIYQGSPTQFRIEAQKQWMPPESSKISLGDIAGAAKHPVATTIQAAEKFGISRRAERQEAAFAKLRDEASRIFTLQGPERDAVARWLLQPEVENKVVGFRKYGGAVQRQQGGRIPTRRERVSAIVSRFGHGRQAV